MVADRDCLWCQGLAFYLIKISALFFWGLGIVFTVPNRRKAKESVEHIIYMIICCKL